MTINTDSEVPVPEPIADPSDHSIEKERRCILAEVEKQGILACQFDKLCFIFIKQLCVAAGPWLCGLSEQFVHPCGGEQILELRPFVSRQ